MQFNTPPLDLKNVFLEVLSHFVPKLTEDHFDVTDEYGFPILEFYNIAVDDTVLNSFTQAVDEIADTFSYRGLGFIEYHNGIDLDLSDTSTVVHEIVEHMNQDSIQQKEYAL